VLASRATRLPARRARSTAKCCALLSAYATRHVPDQRGNPGRPRGAASADDLGDRMLIKLAPEVSISGANRWSVREPATEHVVGYVPPPTLAEWYRTTVGEARGTQGMASGSP